MDSEQWIPVYHLVFSFHMVYFSLYSFSTETQCGCSFSSLIFQWRHFKYLSTVTCLSTVVAKFGFVFLLFFFENDGLDFCEPLISHESLINHPGSSLPVQGGCRSSLHLANRQTPAQLIFSGLSAAAIMGQRRSTCAPLPLKVAERCLCDTVVQCHCQSAEPRTAFG